MQRRTARRARQASPRESKFGPGVNARGLAIKGANLTAQRLRNQAGILRLEGSADEADALIGQARTHEAIAEALQGGSISYSRRMHAAYVAEALKR